MTENYQTAAQSVASAMNAVYENKQTNKKNSISGDFSSDNESYPTVKAVKTEFGTKVDSWSSTNGSTSNYPSEALVKGALNSINSSIETLSGLEVIKVVSTKPTASADTMNKLYIVSESNKVNVYYTTKSGSTYSWKKMDSDILDEFSISWNDIQNKPSFGTGANDFAVGNHTHSTYVTTSDERLIDERDPLMNEFTSDKNINSINFSSFWYIPSTVLNSWDSSGLANGSTLPVTIQNTNSEASLFVIGSDDTNTVKQIFTFEGKSYVRYSTDYMALGTWSGWTEEATIPKVQSEISAFATALANAINPSS